MTEAEYKKMIYESADKVKTKDDLLALIAKIESYPHDYGTIVYGLMAAMKGAFRVVDRGPQGGITGFQAGCIGWECIREFIMLTGGGPLRLVDYGNMLYPQYKDSFEKTLTPEAWEKLKEMAAERLLEETAAHPEVKRHWQNIVGGNIPFGYVLRE
jgi:hypothetical protein